LNRNLNIVLIILILGIIQGFIIAAILIFKKQNSKANKFFSVILAVLCLTLILTYLFEIQYYLICPDIIRVVDALNFLYSPLFYIYTQLLISKIDRVHLKHLLHFIPFILFNLYRVPFYIKDGDYKINYLTGMIQNGFSKEEIIVKLIMCLYGIVYIFAIYRLLKKYSNDIQGFFSNIERVKLGWLKTLIFMGMIIYGVDLVTTALYAADVRMYNQVYEIGPIGTTFFIYICGFFAIKQPEIFSDVKGMNDEFVIETDQLIEGETRKYRTYLFDNDSIESFAERIIAYIEIEKPYLNNELTIKEMARNMNMSSYHLSLVINSYFKINFYTFINNYRVEEAKKLLSSELQSNILNIAFQAGFNSKSTFNEIFKKNTGITPSQYRSQFVS